MKCNQVICEKEAEFLFTWPGKDQAGACAEHANKALGVAGALGMHLQMIPIVAEKVEGA